MQKLRFFVSDGLNDFDESVKVSEIWEKIKELLKEEKEQIIKAVDYGYELDYSDDDNTYTKGEEYFYETFGDNAG